MTLDHDPAGNRRTPAELYLPLSSVYAYLLSGLPTQARVEAASLESSNPELDADIRRLNDALAAFGRQGKVTSADVQPLLELAGNCLRHTLPKPSLESQALAEFGRVLELAGLHWEDRQLVKTVNNPVNLGVSPAMAVWRATLLRAADVLREAGDSRAALIVRNLLSGKPPTSSPKPRVYEHKLSDGRTVRTTQGEPP